MKFEREAVLRSFTDVADRIKMRRRPPGIRFLTGNMFLSDQTDARGRLLQEYAAPAEAIEQAIASGVMMNLKPCPYPDSRRDYPINESAYREMASHWQEILNGLAWLNREYFGGTPPEHVTPEEAQELSLIGRILPIYCMVRVGTPLWSDRGTPDSSGSP